MSNPLLKNIEINKNHIENFQLETTTGTKKTKENFYKKAVEERNKYIKNQYTIFDKYTILLKNEMVIRLKKEMPKDKTKEYTEEENKINESLKNIIINSDIKETFKLKFDYIIESINDEITLESMNNQIQIIIDKLKSINIELTINDFTYTMFTKEYMSNFFDNSSYENMKEVFEKIYFKCPNIKSQLKMNLKNILNKYNKELEKYIEKLKVERNITNSEIDKYIGLREELEEKIKTDEYYNTKVFIDKDKKIENYLENSIEREKIFNKYAKNNDYKALDEKEKENYKESMKDLYNTLDILKKYYNYKNIIDDLIERYKNKNNIKSDYQQKQKEIIKEEKERIKIYKKYIKNNKKSIFKKKNENKTKENMQQMNEQTKKLHDLYQELNNLEVTYELSKLNDSLTIFELLKTSLKSFYFLKNKFSDEKFINNGLEENINEYFKFIYHPNNSIFRKVNALTNDNLQEILKEKYKLLNIEIEEKDLEEENIEQTISDIEFISTIFNIEKSQITINKINNICKMKEIVNREKTNIIL